MNIEKSQPTESKRHTLNNLVPNQSYVTRLPSGYTLGRLSTQTEANSLQHHDHHKSTYSMLQADSNGRVHLSYNESLNVSSSESIK